MDDSHDNARPAGGEDATNSQAAWDGLISKDWQERLRAVETLDAWRRDHP